MQISQIRVNGPSSVQIVCPASLVQSNNKGRLEEVNLDKVFRFSFVAQISDLSLRVFIPLNRLVFPEPETIVSRTSLIDDSFLKKCYKVPLKHFEKSQNLTRLGSILRVLEGGRLRKDKRVLHTLSRDFEALSVYGGTLTAAHWVFEEDSLSLTVWSMLSYYCHCLDKFSKENPHILYVINERLIEAFEKDTPIFREIFEYEKLKEQCDYLSLNRIELQVRKFYEFTWEQPALEEGNEGINMWGMSALLNFPECEKLSDIKSRKVLSMGEKLSLAKDIWESLFSKTSRLIEVLGLEGLPLSGQKMELRLEHLDLADQSHTIRDQVMRSEEVIRMGRTIGAIKNEINRRKPILESRIQKAALNEVKRALQGLYEYEQLGIGLQCTQQLLQRDNASPESYTQWLVVLRESLKMMVTDKTLNISLIRSLSTLSQLIKTIRDYFEHPEDYVLQLDYTSEIKKQEQLRKLKAGLFQDLKVMAEDILLLMEMRQRKIGQILRSHPSIDPKDVFIALSKRDEKQDKRLSDARQLICEKYVKAIEFSNRIIEKKNLRRDVDDEKNSGKQKVAVKEEYLFIPFSHRLSTQQLLDRLIEGCQVLRFNASSLSRSQLELKVSEDIAFRLMIQRQISVATRLLEQFVKRLVKNLKKYRVKHSVYYTLESLYFEARDARNFQTHDLWRTDIQGIVNAIYLLGYECSEVLLSLSEPRPFDADSLEAHVIQEVVWERLTQDKLHQAIDKGLDLNAYDYKNRSLLHFLADTPSTTNLEIAQFVIENGGNIHQVDHKQMRPLHYVAESGFIELAKLLVEQGAAVDACSASGTPTEIAQEHGHIALAQFLSTQRGIRRSSSAKALLDAVKSLDVDKVRMLVAQDYDPLADFEGSLPLVALFEKEDVDFQLQIEIADILFQSGADVNQQEPASGQSVMHTATTYTDEPEVIEFLMHFHPDVNLKDDLKRTPLHNAVNCKNKWWVNALLFAGALVNEKDCLGETPLLGACNKNRPSPQIIEALLKHGAYVEAQGKFGRVLHYAAERGRDSVVSIILEYGASPFTVGRGGLYYHRMPCELSRNWRVTNRLMETMQFLFAHLSDEDQYRLVTLTGRDLTLFEELEDPARFNKDRDEYKTR